MAFVHTAHGLGRIIATETVRGRTRHKVAGPGFEVWLDSTQVRTAEIERDASLGDVNEDNSTTLPYDPTPQYPSDMWAHDTTIQPGEQEIDAEERLSPSDSIDFDSRSNRSFPGPDPSLFAKNAYHEAGIKEWWDEISTHPREKEPLVVEDADEWLRNHPPHDDDDDDDDDEEEAESRKKVHARLGSKYATWMLAAPEGDDSVSRFRRDPIQEINRLGYLWTGGSEDPEMADYGRLVEADKMLREAAWTDVRRKAQRLRREGRVHVLHRGPGNIYANVEGDNGTYTTMIAKTGNTQSIDKWACSCEWGKWAFQRKISYVGRLCSHGYASYLELQSDQHKGNPGRFHHPRRTAGVVDDFQDYVNDFRDGHVDIDAADNFITLPEHSQKEDPYTEDEVQDIYDWTRDNLTEREPRNYKMPYYAAESSGERAEVLRTHPRSLTPDLVKVPRGEDPYFVDVEEDERETTGPDGIMHKEAGPLKNIRNMFPAGKNKNRVSPQEAIDWYGGLAPHEKNWVRDNYPDHFVVRMDNEANGFNSDYRHAALVDAMGNSYTPGGFWRTADEDTSVVDDKKNQDGSMPPSTSAGQSSSSAGQSSSSAGQLSDPSVATPRVPDVENASPSLSPDSSQDSGQGGFGQGLQNAGRGLQNFMDIALPIIDNVSSFAAPIAQGIGNAIGNIGSGLLHRSNHHYAEDDSNSNGWEVPEGDLEHLRELSDDDPDLGHTDSQNREKAHLIDDLREDGYDVSQIVASYGLGNQGQGQPGGAFGQPGGGSWADRAFSGSGPDPKYWFGTSEDLLDRGDEDIEEVDVTEGSGETNHWNESERPGQGKKANRFLFSNDNDMHDELLQSVGEEIEGIGQYEQFLDEAHELGDEDAAGAIEEALDDETDHVKNFTNALDREAGMNDIVRRFQASGGGALANDSASGGAMSDDAIAGQARKFLAKTAGRVYSLAEQRELIEESHPGGARNKPTDDDLAGTHYV